MLRPLGVGLHAPLELYRQGLEGHRTVDQASSAEEKFGRTQLATRRTWRARPPIDAGVREANADSLKATQTWLGADADARVTGSAGLSLRAGDCLLFGEEAKKPASCQLTERSWLKQHQLSWEPGSSTSTGTRSGEGEVTFGSPGPFGPGAEGAAGGLKAVISGRLSKASTSFNTSSPSAVSSSSSSSTSESFDPPMNALVQLAHSLSINTTATGTVPATTILSSSTLEASIDSGHNGGDKSVRSPQTVVASSLAETQGTGIGPTDNASIGPARSISELAAITRAGWKPREVRSPGVLRPATPLLPEAQLGPAAASMGPDMQGCRKTIGTRLNASHLEGSKVGTALGESGDSQQLRVLRPPCVPQLGWRSQQDGTLCYTAYARFEDAGIPLSGRENREATRLSAGYAGGITASTSSGLSCSSPSLQASAMAQWQALRQRYARPLLGLKRRFRCTVQLPPRVLYYRGIYVHLLTITGPTRADILRCRNALPSRLAKALITARDKWEDIGTSVGNGGHGGSCGVVIGAGGAGFK
ncbi:unnamed protein product [Protopolystoma xenopodis]|uniref:Uncharacterized protein n=1 Tax=Protopolystoma xenopodis TaxID=117903 RepID=A0A3S5AA80_9PLAT|nr:unnamed protein product [Protopolystoma xenopodis]